MSNEHQEDQPVADNENSSILGSSSSNSSAQADPNDVQNGSPRPHSDAKALEPQKVSSSRQKLKEQRSSTRARDTKDQPRSGNQQHDGSGDSRSQSPRVRSLSNSSTHKRRKRAQSDDSRPSSRRNRRGRSRSSRGRSYSRSRSYSHHSRSRTHSPNAADYRETENNDNFYRGRGYDQDRRNSNYRDDRGHHRRGDYKSRGNQQSGSRPPYNSRSGDNNNNNGRWNKDLIHQQDNGLYVPSLSLPLVSYQQFAQLQTRHIRDLAGQYEQYKLDHEDKHFRQFLYEHEREEWFKEKYFPVVKYQLHLVQQECALKTCEQFQFDMDFVDVNKWTIWIKNVPVWVSRAQLRETTGCGQLYCSEPLRMSKFQRICWLRFDSQEQYQAILNATIKKNNRRGRDNSDYSDDAGHKNHDQANNSVSGFEVFEQLQDSEKDARERHFVAVPQKSAIQQPVGKKTPELPQDTIGRDLGFAKQLVELFDQEIGTEMPKIDTDLSEEQQLEMVVKYLRIVHGYCFYSGVRCEDERQLAIKTCLYYERVSNQLKSEPGANHPEPMRTPESLSFEQNYLLQAESIIQKGPQPFLNPAETDEQLKEKIEDFCARNCVQLIEGEKYRCEVAGCGKTFRGEDFVRKHILNKHENLLLEFQDKLFNIRAREAYINDSARIENPPLAHSSNFQNVNGGGPGFGKFQRNRRDYGNNNGGGGGDKSGANQRDMNGRGNKSYGNTNTNGGNLNGRSDDAVGSDPSKTQQPPREYVDYDDPMAGQASTSAANHTTIGNGVQINGVGHFNQPYGQVQGGTMVTGNQQQTQQQFGGAMHQNNNGNTGFTAAVNRQSKQQIVSYDDLF